MNARRAENGQAPLTRNSCLDGISTDWSTNMANTQSQVHNTSFSQQYASRCSIAGGGASENIGNGRSIGTLNAAWWASTGHRNNMLRASHTKVGIGVVRDSNGRAWATVNFAN